VKKPYSKKLRLPLLFVDGKWELEFGGQVPVPYGTTAEILVDVSKITDRSFSEKMLARSRPKPTPAPTASTRRLRDAGWGVVRARKSGEIICPGASSLAAEAAAARRTRSRPTTC
jgi:hypothetical protein